MNYFTPMMYRAFHEQEKEKADKERKRRQLEEDDDDEAEDKLKHTVDMEENKVNHKHNPKFVGGIRNKTVDTYVDYISKPSLKIIHYSQHYPLQFVLGACNIPYYKDEADKLLLQFVKNNLLSLNIKRLFVKEVRSERQLISNNRNESPVYRDHQVCICEKHMTILSVGLDKNNYLECEFYNCELLNIPALFPETTRILQDVEIIISLTKPKLRELARNRNLKARWFNTRKTIQLRILQDLLDSL